MVNQRFDCDGESTVRSNSPEDPRNFFCDVPVYRLGKNEYYRKRSTYIDRALYPEDQLDTIALNSQNKTVTVHFRDHLEKSYGGAWRFNEIIGYIRLHFLSTQLRGEFYAVRRKRVVRTRRKLFEFHTWNLVQEREIPTSCTSEKIYSIILEYIDECRRKLRNRYIDSSGLEKIGPYVDWKALYDAG